MFEALVSTNHLSFLLVFIEGILSFFSPCVIPLIPIYMSYLAGNAEQVDDQGNIHYGRKKVFLHTLCFVLGISTAFFILGMSFTALGSFFQNNKILFTRIGGIVIILLGLFQLEIFEFKFLNRERKLNLNLHNKEVNPLMAYAMGFTFSFAWTPCVGPALSSVLILASGASSSFLGNLLIFTYAIGFVIPFLLLGIFTTQALNFLEKRQNFLKYTVKAGGVLLVLIGIMTFTGWMNGISGYLNSFDSPLVPKSEQGEQIPEEEKEDENSSGDHGESSQKDGKKTDVLPAMDFTLTDQYGKEHTLSDYKGKVVFLNFWATWCPPCKKEMPDIESLYHQFDENQGDVVILGVAGPKNELNPHTQEVNQEGILEFLQENKITFPIVFDMTNEVFRQYHISALPTTFMIDKEGNIHGYAPGMLTKDMMRSIIQETLDSSK